jgi:hypothetical protein
MTVLRPDKNGERGLWINRNAGRNLWRKNVWLLGLITALAFGVSVYAQDRDDYGER